MKSILILITVLLVSGCFGKKKDTTQKDLASTTSRLELPPNYELSDILKDKK